jgi:hypothetical protein
MKTLQQIQQELNTYLEKTSQHVFVRTEGKVEYFRLFDTKTKDGKILWVGVTIDEELKASKIRVQYNVANWSDPNAKNGIKHEMFLNRDYKSLRLKKKTQNIVDTIREIISTMDEPERNWRVIGQFQKDVIEKALLVQ